ncbi:glycosyltransferase involved in cell wall biosynthesis [Haloferula luteola]|uniref:Glycosyltransferase involved in cell wall biosynthesis n=1 Tax=Haloferula luteola TaxID=595692 RepID=A0A840V600_9BACT|nr:glycosyltransferase family 4 protein [Haloferula luteola]MBB5352456.1 glycosyltransferase involved in cell wall biosynthesis [Haloferula luteola]
MTSHDQRQQRIRNAVFLVRADPIICGHSTEARNLAEAALAMGLEQVHIVSYPYETLESSGLPLKARATVTPYSDGIVVDRPEPLGDYKVLDGRLGLGISGHLADLLHRLPGRTMMMDLYLVPHGLMVMQAVNSFRMSGKSASVFTVGEAVGSDITNVVGNALAEGRLGAAQVLLSNYLEHDLPVAVSQFTKDLIVDAGRRVDAQLGSDFGSRLERRVGISYPAIDTAAYLALDEQTEAVETILSSRQLKKDGYVMFLSRIAAAKGVDDLLDAWKRCKLRGSKELIICGNGPALPEIQEQAAALGDVRVMTDVSDDEKGALMHGCFAWCLPSKPRTEFVETFGIAVAEKLLSGGLGPVITTRTGGIPEASGGYCLEHEAGDVEGLVRCLDRAAAMTDAERAALSKAGRNHALQFDRAAILSSLLSRAVRREVVAA